MNQFLFSVSGSAPKHVNPENFAELSLKLESSEGLRERCNDNDGKNRMNRWRAKYSDAQVLD